MSYCTIDEFKDLGLPPDSITELDDAQLQLFIDTAAGVIDSYVADRYDVSPPVDNGFLRRINVDLTACDVLLWRGYNAEEGDEQYGLRCARWLGVLEDVRKGNLGIPGLEPSPSGGGGPKFRTRPRRGYLGTCTPDAVGGVN